MNNAPPSEDANLVQMAANAGAWWNHHGFGPFLPLRVEVDRLWYPYTDGLWDAIDDLACRGVLVKTLKPKNHGPNVKAGWREDAQPSAQIIYHDNSVSEDEIEFDFDKFSPMRDVIGGAGHLIEVLHNKRTKGKTNPFEMARRLGGRGIHAA